MNILSKNIKKGFHKKLIQLLDEYDVELSCEDISTFGHSDIFIKADFQSGEELYLGRLVGKSSKYNKKNPNISSNW